MKRLLCLLLIGLGPALAAAQPMPGFDPVFNRSPHEDAFRQLARQAQLGVGLRLRPLGPDEAPAQRPPAPEPTLRELGVGVPRAEFRAEQAAKRRAQAEQLARDSLKANRDASARLTDMHGDMVKRCGEPLPQWPQLGMGVAELNCTVGLRFGGVRQDLLLDQGGHRYQLWVLADGPLRRIWLLDLRVVRIDTTRATASAF